MWKTNFAMMVLGVLHHWQIIANKGEFSWTSLPSGPFSPSGTLLFVTASSECPCCPWGADTQLCWGGEELFPYRLDLVAPVSRPGLQHEVGAKPQWHPSHLQTYWAWVQTHKHKIKLCYSESAHSCSGWLCPSSRQPSHLSLCNAFYPWIRTQRGFIYHWLPLLAGSTQPGLHLSPRLAGSTWIEVFCLGTGRHVLLTGLETNLRAALTLHPLCTWHLMTQLEQFGFIM